MVLFDPEMSCAGMGTSSVEVVVLVWSWSLALGGSRNLGDAGVPSGPLPLSVGIALFVLNAETRGKPLAIRAIEGLVDAPLTTEQSPAANSVTEPLAAALLVVAAALASIFRALGGLVEALLSTERSPTDKSVTEPLVTASLVVAAPLA
jgi:hypothetical protein